MAMLTCTYSDLQQGLGLGLAALPLLVLARGVQSGQTGSSMKALVTVVLAVKATEDLAATYACHISLVSQGLRTAILLGKAVELTLISMLLLLSAKGLGIFRSSLVTSETSLLILIGLLVFLAWSSFLMAPDTLHLGLILDLAALFCITTKSLLESQLIMRALLRLEPTESLVRKNVAYLRNFQGYFTLYNAVLLLRWVCVPVSYLPLLPDIALYIWLGLGLQAAELAAVLPLLWRILACECLNVSCTDEEVQLPMYLPCHCEISRFPVLVLTPGLKQERYLGEELLTTN